MTTSGPSSNWFALQKTFARFGRPRKRRKVDGKPSSDTTPAFPRATPSSLPTTQLTSDDQNECVDLDTTEVMNGESVAGLRRMVLGKVEYTTSHSVPGKYLALDCEMVGVGIEGSESSLARVSIVNYTGAVVLDVFVKQREKVVDYRTQWSGVRSTDLAGSAKPFREVQEIVADLIKDRILVGHAIHNDLKALLLSHPSQQIRDTQSLAYKNRIIKSRRPALRVLVEQELGIAIQGGEHSSVTDARATMALFRLHKRRWEGGFRSSRSLTRSQLSAFSEPRDRKRKRSDSGRHTDMVPEPPTLSSATVVCSPSSSSIPNIRTPTQHASTGAGPLGQSRSQPPPDSAQRKGISSGISTVTKRVRNMKDVKRKGARGVEGTVGNGSAKSGKKISRGGEQWWKSLGVGKKGSVTL